MTETDVMDPPAPPKPAKKRRGPQRRKADPKPVEFAGLTARDCCDDCGPKGCVITKGGSGICAHPRKSGLQSADMMRPQVADRYRRAKKYLDHQALDRRAG